MTKPVPSCMIKTLKIEVRLSRVTGREAAGACDRLRKGKSPKAMSGKHPPGCFGNTTATVIIFLYDGALSVLPRMKKQGKPEQYYYIGLMTGFQPVFLFPVSRTQFIMSGGTIP